MDEIEGGVEEQAGGEAGSGEELALVREVVLRAHPDAVPELIAGATIAELLASVEPARAAYTRIVERQTPAAGALPSVPAGAAVAVVDPATLPAQELIRRGVEAERRRGGKADRKQ